MKREQVWRLFSRALMIIVYFTYGSLWSLVRDTWHVAHTQEDKGARITNRTISLDSRRHITAITGTQVRTRL